MKRAVKDERSDPLIHISRHLRNTTILTVIVLSILLLSPQLYASTITEWTIPTSNSQPYGIVVAGGLLYFTEWNGNKIGRLDPSTGVFTEWTVPTSSSSPIGIAVAGGLVYFTEEDGNKIGRLMVDPVATTTVAVAKTFSTATTGSSVSTASTTFLATNTVNYGNNTVASNLATTTSSATSISDTVTVEPLARTNNPPRNSGTVGGELYSVNKLVVVAPFLALIAVAAVSTVYVVKSRRKAS